MQAQEIDLIHQTISPRERVGSWDETRGREEGKEEKEGGRGEEGRELREGEGREREREGGRP